MKTYIGLLDTVDGTFGVSFPDAPGCAVMASTEQSAINEASLALREWIADEARDGRPTPPPRSVADIVGITTSQAHLKVAPDLSRSS